MLEILEFCFRDFGTFLGITLWISIIAYGISRFHLVEIFNTKAELESEKEHGM